MDVGLYDRVQQRLALSADSAQLSHGMLVLTLAAPELLATVQLLKTELTFDLLLDVTAVDWPQRPLRFDVVYHLYSTAHGVRIRLKTSVAESDATVDTLTSLFGSARFLERECHDMYGIAFRGNPDLRPLLLYEGFQGHPLRKDYPIDREQPLVPYRS
jgi:NADH-quinone oxidoreductase subunit C